MRAWNLAVTAILTRPVWAGEPWALALLAAGLTAFCVVGLWAWTERNLERWGV